MKLKVSKKHSMSRALCICGAGKKDEPVKPTRILKPATIPGKQQQAEEKVAQPRAQEVLDVTKLIQTRSFQQLKPYEPAYSGEAIKLGKSSVMQTAQDVNDLYGSMVGALEGITPDFQKSLTDRDTLNNALAGIKFCQRHVQNVSQVLSIIEAVLANRLNYVRQQNLDNKGARGVRVAEGQTFDYNGQRVMLKGDKLVPVNPE